jgi:hypothetical protein
MGNARRTSCVKFLGNICNLLVSCQLLQVIMAAAKLLRLGTNIYKWQYIQKCEHSLGSAGVHAFTRSRAAHYNIIKFNNWFNFKS